jgi:hypothetical protein
VTIVTTIKATCPSCGDVQLVPEQVRLVVCNVKDWSYYAFTCTGCHDEVRKPAGPDVVKLLRTGGVVAEKWQVPAEVLEDRSGPGIDWDDVLDFALWLDGADNVAAAAASLAHHRRAVG